MRFTNKTHWDTQSLRAIATRVAAEELSDTERQRRQRRHLTARVVYTRQRHGLSGCAYIRGIDATLRLHKLGPIDSVEFAWLCAHEFAHIRGMRHPQMPEWLMHFTDSARARFAWAADYSIVRKATKPAPTPEQKADAKLVNIRTRLAQARTRAKRATTILRKWERRERDTMRRLDVAAGRSGKAEA